MKRVCRVIYRIESNYGSKYFVSLTKADKHFDNMLNCGYDTEMWKITYSVNASAKFPVSAKQVLLKCSLPSMERYF